MPELAFVTFMLEGLSSVLRRSFRWQRRVHLEQELAAMNTVERFGLQPGAEYPAGFGIIPSGRCTRV